MRRCLTYVVRVMSDRLFTAKELASILGVNPQTIYRAGQRGEIESYKIGKSVRFSMPDERTKQCLKKDNE